MRSKSSNSLKPDHSFEPTRELLKHLLPAMWKRKWTTKESTNHTFQTMLSSCFPAQFVRFAVDSKNFRPCLLHSTSPCACLEKAINYLLEHEVSKFWKVFGGPQIFELHDSHHRCLAGTRQGTMYSIHTWGPCVVWSWFHWLIHKNLAINLQKYDPNLLRAPSCITTYCATSKNRELVFLHIAS